MSAATLPDALEGPAFPRTVKALATLTVAAMLGWGLRAAPSLWAEHWSGASAWLFAGALAMVLWCLSWIWRSRTAADARGVRQSWMWDKEVAWADVAQARIVALPGLEWLVAPRLVLRVRGRGLMVFHAADRRVLQAFALFVATGTRPCATSPCP